MVRIITDSTADISPERREELGIDILPLTVNFGEESFIEGVNLSTNEFYEKLEQSKVLPTTSQIPPSEFHETFERYISQGDEVVAITISSHLSGTFQSSCIAKEMTNSDKVFVIDSLTATFQLRLLVEEAVMMRDAGMSGAEIAKEVKELIGRIKLVAVVGTLKYLKMGGRLSTASAVVGTLLGICPVISIIDGKVEAIGKCRGQKAAFEFMHKHMQRENVDYSRPIAFGHTCAPEEMEKWKAFILPKIPKCDSIDGYIGSVVGTHVGPGATGIAYFVK